MSKQYRNKPVVIEAFQFHEEDGLKAFRDNTLLDAGEYFYSNGFFIKTLEGIMEVSDGDYVIRGVKGGYYPCNPDIFEQTYEAVEL